MAEAVFDSAALILCLSSFYNNSCHCIKEVISAYEYRIPLLPVVVESDYVPINFLRFLLTGVQPIQLYNDCQVDDAADRLTEQLRCYGVMREGANVNQSRPPTCCASRLNPPPPVSVDTVKRHQRSRSDCLNGIFVNRKSSEPTQSSISTGRAQFCPSAHQSIVLFCLF